MRILACIRLLGALELVDDQWSGWRLQDGKLHSSTHRRGFTPSELEFLPFTAQRVAALEATIRCKDSELKQTRSDIKALHNGSEPRAELLRAMGRCELMMRMLAGATAEMDQSADERVRELQNDTVEMLKGSARLYVKLHEQASRSDRDPQQPDLGNSPALVEQLANELVAAYKEV